MLHQQPFKFSDFSTIRAPRNWNGFNLLLCITMGISCLLQGCGEHLTEEQEAESDRLMNEIEYNLYISDITQPFTKEQYPNVYAQWGEDWMNNINAMMPLAAERVHSQVECDKVRTIDLSPSSIVKEKPIVAINCENQERFNVSINDTVKEKRLLPQSKLFFKTPSYLTEKCLAEISSEFVYSDSIEVNEVDTLYDFNNGKQQVEITIPFNVKTEFNTRTNHMIKCSYGANLLPAITFLPKSKAL